MTESLRQLVERLVYGSGYAETASNAAFFQRYGLPRPALTITEHGRFTSVYLRYQGREDPDIVSYSYGDTRAAAHVMLAVAELEKCGREVPAELQSIASLLLAEGAASVGREAS